MKGNNIQDELRETAPLLSLIERKNVFQVPEDYFGLLEDSLVAAASDQTEERIRGHENMFHVPSAYFNQLPETILEKIHQRKKHVVISIDYRIWLAAASIAVVIAVGYFFRSVIFPAEKIIPVVAANESPISADSVLLAYVNEVDEATLISVISENNPAPQSENNSSVNQINSESYNEYLVDATDVDPELMQLTQ